MKLIAIALASLVVSAPALAQSTHSTAVVLSEGVSQAEAGGCNADFLPVAIAAYCFNRGSDANPTGGQLGSLGSNGSDGGGDGDGGSGGGAAE